MNFSVEKITQAFSQLIKPNASLVVVHSSLGILGNIPDLQNTILAALFRALPAHCTLALPTFTFSFCQTGIFDVQNTPSEVGMLGETFRKMPGVVRTQHPIYSFAVRGPLISNFLKCQGKTCWGEGSVFELMEVKNADLVMLGCGWEYCTLFHRLEELRRVSYRYKKHFVGQIVGEDITTSVGVDMWVRKQGLPIKNCFKKLVPVLREQGVVRTQMMGRGMAEAIEAKEIMRIGNAVLEKDEFAVLDQPETYVNAAQATRVAIMGSTNLDVFAGYFSKTFVEYFQSQCRLYVPPFNQYRQNIIVTDSELYAFAPQWLVFLERAEDLFGEITDASASTIESQIDNYLDMIITASHGTNARVLVMNFDLPDTAPFFLNSTTNHLSHHYVMIRHANEYLQKKLVEMPDVFCIDYQTIRENFGRRISRDEKYWLMGRVPFSRDFSLYLSRRLVGAMLSIMGQSTRLLVLDLDNTVWGGILGDEGMEGIRLGGDFPGNAYVDFQKTLLSLSKRGITLAICSKNTESLAIVAIEKHPHMILRLDHFVAHRINWLDKASNIRSLAEELSLGLQSICFIDDSPYERQWVRQNLPEVTVPEFPTDPTKYSSFLLDLPCLDVLSVTKEDGGRVEKYKARHEVERMKNQSHSLEDFYRSLKMRVFIETYNEGTQARTLQLLAKTNQFNATTKRYSASDLQRLQAEGAWIRPIGLKDNFGEKEIIGVVIVCWPKSQSDVAVVDSLLLSCRVMGRSVESAILGWVAKKAKEKHVTVLQGMVLPTKRNQPVRDVFTRHGFKNQNDQLFELNLASTPLVIPDWFTVSEMG